ncbi:MAG: ester cyclase [Chloroflexota bacterium]|nr:ester cyclase [Chloroflexota bacterium]
MSVEQRKALVRREIADVWHKGDLAVIDEIYAAHFVNHSPFPSTTPDRDGLKESVKAYRGAFPDIRLTIEDLIAKADRVVERVPAAGTRRGEVMGVAPTGKRIEIPVTTINRFAGSGIVERWSVADMPAMMQQLGVMPSQ